jgi:hypothetical protein
VCSLAGLSLDFGLPRLLGLFVCNLLLAHCASHWRVGFASQRTLLTSASALCLAGWLHDVVAAGASWAPGGWLDAIVAPWRLGLPIGGAPVLFAWIVGAYISARGLLIGSAATGRVPVARWFTVGVVLWVLLFAFLARAGVTESLPTAHLRNLTLGYFALGLFLVALAQQRGMFLREGARPQLSFAFFAAFAAPVTGLFCVALLVLGGMQTFRGALFAVAAVLQGGMLALGFMLRQAAELFIGMLRWLGSFGAGAGPDRSALGSAGAESWAGSSAAHPQGFSSLAPDITPFLLGAAAALVVALFFAALWRRPGRQPALESIDESSSVWSLQLFAEQWSALWRSFVSDLRARAHALASPRGAQALTPVVVNTLRDVYRALLSWAARSGQERAPATTPLEFAEQLGRDVPHQRERLDELTAQYIEVRYGDREERSAALERAKQLLRELAEHDASG